MKQNILGKSAIILMVVTFIGLLNLSCRQSKETETHDTIELNEANISAFATSIVKAVHQGDASQLNNAIDKDYIKSLVTENSIVYSGFDVEGGEAYFEKCLHLGNQAVQTVNNGGDFTFVKYYTLDNEHHVIFRSYDNFALNFWDFEVDTVGGELRLHDGFLYNAGCLLSKSVQYGMLYNLMLQTNPDSEVQWLQKAEEQTINGKHAEALRILTEHRTGLEEYPIYWQLFIANLYKTAPSRFIQELNALEESGLNQRYLLLHRLLYYTNNGQVAETEQTIDQLIPHTGDDPIYLLFYGKAAMLSGKYADALTVLQTAEEVLPLLWDLWYAELQCYKHLNDTAGYKKCLSKGKEAYGMSDSELKNLKVD